jgi:radical SAM superfamily enzyme YgiQ (UPF0313 family)
MKILFIVKSKTIETLGPMYLASVAKERGWEARIMDIGEAIVFAPEMKPNVVGYSIMTGDQERFRTLNEQFKSKWSFTSIVGGPHPTFFKNECTWADVQFPGEAEHFLGWFLGGKEIVYRGIDEFPWPDRSDFKGHRIRDFITSRGCPFNCSYCYNDRWSQLTSGSPVRTRNYKDVVNEILDVNPEFVYFQDSCFGVSMKWLHGFSIMYRKLVNIPFHCHLRPSQVDQERVLCLHDANCASVRIALETASKRLLKILNRENTDLNQIADAVRLLKKWNIKLMMQNMIGLPTGTIEDDMETLEFNVRCKPAYGWCSIFQPYPGTELGDMCKTKGIYKGDYSEITDCFFDGSVLEFDPLYKEQLQCLQKIFALSVETGVMPHVKELTHANFQNLVHRITRKLGDSRLYPGVM